MSGFGEAIVALVRAQRRTRFAASRQLSLGQLIAGLREAGPPHAPVRYDDGSFPTTVASYRGSYDELALGFRWTGEPRRLAEVLAECERAVGETFEGYKGGDYRMGTDTPVWVANWGTTGDAAPIGVHNDGRTVVIDTAPFEF